MWDLLSRWGMDLWHSLGSPHGIQTSPHLVKWKTSLCQATARKSGLISSQGISVSIPLEAANSGSLSHTYSWEMPPLVVLLESWDSFWVEAEKSVLISRWFGVHGDFHELLCWNWCSSRLGTMYSGNFWSHLKEDHPFVMFHVERGMALEPMHWNQTTSWVVLGYTELFLIAVVTSWSL